MATKGTRLFLSSDKKNYSFGHNSQEQQYSNLNLNQISKNSIGSFVHSNSKLTIDKQFVAFKVSGTKTFCNNEAEKQILNKSFKLDLGISNSVISSNHGKQPKNQWKNDDYFKDKTYSNKDSTLSLHITAYENSIENGGVDSTDKQVKNSFLASSTAALQNPFELPRQQDKNHADPEVMKFKSSQKLSKSSSSTSNQDGKDGKEGKDKEKKEGGTITQQDDEVSITDDVRGADYYHGLVPRIDIEPLLKKDGDFLLRKTDNKGQIVLAVSAFHENRVCHFMVNQDTDNTFYIEEHHEKTVGALIDWHIKTKTPMSSDTGCKLRTPIERPNWLLNHDSLKLKKRLGEGAFGEVYLSEFNGPTGKSEVAAKTMRDEASREARLKFMKEARLMRKFNHKHVVKIYGVAVHENPLMIIMEFCPGGSLLSYLRTKKDKLSNNTRLRFAIEAADGLWYLERQKLVHRDVAARNCLLTAKNELKISDFGMSDEREKLIVEEKLEKVPIKWLAIETMQNKIYSHKTDVWSYAVLCYEIYANGNEPYPGWTNLQTRAKIVMHDYRMDMPKDTPKAVSTLVALCWQKEPEKRPDFGTIFKRLKELNKKDDSTMAKV